MEKILMFSISGLSTFLLLFCRKRKYLISWGVIVSIFCGVGVMGYIGASVGSYLSYGTWTGIRFYSKALFVTVALWCLAKIFKIDVSAIMDYYAPIDISALIVMKINCLSAGCCSGIELYTTASGYTVCFPSRELELLVAAMVFLIIILLEFKSKCNGYRYYIYLLIYGATRFFFELFRATPSNGFYFVGIHINITHLFCVILIAVGVVGICLRKKSHCTDCTENRYR